MIALSLPITEASQIADARRKVAQRARDLSLSEALIDQITLVTSELATNLLKFAHEGTLLVSGYEDADGDGIQVLALDKGPGMDNVARCMEDGYSTAGSAGHGLGAVRRLAHDFAIGSWRSGTVVMARIGPGRAGSRPAPLWGHVEIPMRGEEACGDAICPRSLVTGWSIIVADGLGHGPAAAVASVEAIRQFRRHEQLAPSQILEQVHEGLRATRGAAAAVCRLDAPAETISYAGIGNIAAMIVGPHSRRQLVSMPGTAGHNARKITTFDYAFAPGCLLVMHSDGISSSWSFDGYPGLLAAHPMIVVGVLLRDHARARDDASVIVARAGTAS